MTAQEIVRETGSARVTPIMEALVLPAMTASIVRMKRIFWAGNGDGHVVFSSATGRISVSDAQDASSKAPISKRALFFMEHPERRKEECAD
jgi:G3E family GTPase